MAIQKIQYTNKEQLVNDTTIKDKYKCKADDLNEIKTVVNNNADEIPSNDNLVNVGASVDTNYRTNILYSKNLCDGVVQRLWLSSDGSQCGIAPASKGLYIKVNGGNYTISTTQSQARYRIACLSTLPTSSQSVTGYNGVGKDGTSDTVTIDTTGYNYLVVDATDVSKIQIEKGSTATTYEPFIQNTINVNNEKYTDTINVGTTINDKNRVNVLYSKNLLNINTSVNAAFVVNSTSETLDASTQAITSAWIPCKPNTTYTLGGQYNRNRWQTKAANGTITYAGQDGTTITTNSTAAWIRVYYWFQDGGGTIQPNAKNTMLVEGTNVPSEYIPYITPSINIDGEEIYSRPVVLWTNSSPASSFLPADITLSNDKYNYLEVYFRTYTGQNSIKSVKVEKGQNITMDCAFSTGSGTSVFLGTRQITYVNDTTLSVGTGRKLIQGGALNSGDDNGWIIPIKVIGYK